MKYKKEVKEFKKKMEVYTYKIQPLKYRERMRLGTR